MSKELTLFVTVALVLACCQTKSIQTNSVSTNSSQNARHSAVHAQMNPPVTLQILERSNETVLIAVTNVSDQPIFTFYEPPTESQVPTFIICEVQRKAIGETEFKPYTPPFHFVPDLNPIAPGGAIRSHIDVSGLEEGEYRLHVGYWDDVNVFKLYHDKWPNMSDTELEQMRRTSKSVYSEVFNVIQARKS